MLKKFVVIGVAAIILILALSAIQAEDQQPAVSTSPDIGQPSITNNSSFYDFQWCDTGDVPRKTKIKIDIDSIKKPPSTSIRDWLKKVVLINSGNVGRKNGPIISVDYSSDEITKASLFVTVDSHWRNQQATNGARSASSWRHIDKHIGVSIGAPSSTTKMPPQIFGMQIFTNADSWQFLPIADNDGDGKASSIRLKLTGKPGTKDTFGALIPKALVKKWGLNKENLGGFINGRKVKLTVQKGAKGALVVSFNLTYPVKSVSFGKTK